MQSLWCLTHLAATHSGRRHRAHSHQVRHAWCFDTPVRPRAR
jgi:hypothetical protein